MAEFNPEMYDEMIYLDMNEVVQNENLPSFEPRGKDQGFNKLNITRIEFVDKPNEKDASKRTQYVNIVFTRKEDETQRVVRLMNPYKQSKVEFVAMALGQWKHLFNALIDCPIVTVQTKNGKIKTKECWTKLNLDKENLFESLFNETMRWVVPTYPDIEVVVMMTYYESTLTIPRFAPFISSAFTPEKPENFKWDDNYMSLTPTPSKKAKNAGGASTTGSYSGNPSSPDKEKDAAAV